jgi:hypothetical protein
MINYKKTEHDAFLFECQLCGDKFEPELDCFFECNFDIIDSTGNIDLEILNLTNIFGIDLIKYIEYYKNGVICICRTCESKLK